jgi:hypothetical protein
MGDGKISIQRERPLAAGNSEARLAYILSTRGKYAPRRDLGSNKATNQT